MYDITNKKFQKKKNKNVCQLCDLLNILIKVFLIYSFIIDKNMMITLNIINDFQLYYIIILRLCNEYVNILFL